MTTKQTGFTLVEVVALVLVVGLIGFVGVRVWGSYATNQLAQDSTSVETVRQVTTAADVEAVEKQLDAIDVVGSFEKELDTETTF
jgi:type II secretory pathway pseudopilin PulG